MGAEGSRRQRRHDAEHVQRGPAKPGDAQQILVGVLLKTKKPLAGQFLFPYFFRTEKQKCPLVSGHFCCKPWFSLQISTKSW